MKVAYTDIGPIPSSTVAISLCPRAPEIRHIMACMVRPERRVLLASGSLARVSAGAPGSRPRTRAEMSSVQAGRQKPLQKTGARKRAAISSERCSHVILSAERWIKCENSSASYGCVPSRVRHGVSMRCTTGSTGVTSCGKRGDECAVTEERREWIARRWKTSSSRVWTSFWRASKLTYGQADIAPHR